MILELNNSCNLVIERKKIKSEHHLKLNVAIRVKQENNVILEYYRSPQD